MDTGLAVLIGILVGSAIIALAFVAGIASLSHYLKAREEDKATEVTTHRIETDPVAPAAPNVAIAFGFGPADIAEARRIRDEAYTTVLPVNFKETLFLEARQAQARFRALRDERLGLELAEGLVDLTNRAHAESDQVVKEIQQGALRVIRKYGEGVIPALTTSSPPTPPAQPSKGAPAKVSPGRPSRLDGSMKFPMNAGKTRLQVASEVGAWDAQRGRAYQEISTDPAEQAAYKTEYDKAQAAKQVGGSGPATPSAAQPATPPPGGQQTQSGAQVASQPLGPPVQQVVNPPAGGKGSAASQS